MCVVLNKQENGLCFWQLGICNTLEKLLVQNRAHLFVKLSGFWWKQLGENITQNIISRSPTESNKSNLKQIRICQHGNAYLAAKHLAYKKLLTANNKTFL